MKWTTKQGKTIKVKDMDDEHAKNTINMLIRNHTPQIILECILRGEILEQKPEDKNHRSISLELMDCIETHNDETFSAYEGDFQDGDSQLYGDMAQQFNDTKYEEYDPAWYKEGF